MGKIQLKPSHITFAHRHVYLSGVRIGFIFKVPICGITFYDYQLFSTATGLTAEIIRGDALYDNPRYATAALVRHYRKLSMDEKENTDDLLD